jgi:hypothetical protein
MANHVNTHVRFEKLNDAGKAKLQELYSRIRPEERGYEWFSDIFGLDKEITDLYEWNLENVGPKWCHFEDRGEDYFTTTSAWSFPQKGVEWVFEQVAAADPDFIASVFYEDEMPNFFGVYVYNKDGMVDGSEWESEEVTEIMEEAVPELSELNAETDSEKYWDIWSDNIWDLVSEKQHEVFKDVMESLKE